MKGGRESLSSMEVAQLMELPHRGRKGDINWANNQVWSHPEGHCWNKFAQSGSSRAHNWSIALTLLLHNRAIHVIAGNYSRQL